MLTQSGKSAHVESITCRQDAVDVSGSAHNALGSMVLPSEDVDYRSTHFDAACAALGMGNAFQRPSGTPVGPKPLGVPASLVNRQYAQARTDAICSDEGQYPGARTSRFSVNEVMFYRGDDGGVYSYEGVAMYELRFFDSPGRLFRLGTSQSPVGD